MIRDQSSEFPINKDIIYLNNASYAPIPQTIIRKLSFFLSTDYSTYGPDSKFCNLKKKVDDARKAVSELIHCHPDEIVFTQSITHGINIVAEGLSFQKNDSIVLREASKDHVANFLPWLKRSQCDELTLEILGTNKNGAIDLDSIERYISQNKGGLISLPHASYNFGTLIDVPKISSLAHKHGYYVFIDAGQTVGCRPIDVKKLGCDFLAFSGYKWLCSAPGIGVLYIKREIQDKILYYGLDVRSLASRNEGERVFLDFSDTDYSLVDGPQRLEAGFRNYLGVVGLTESINFLNKLGLDSVQAHNESLIEFAISELSTIPNIMIYGPASVSERTSLVSFSIPNHPVSDMVAHLSAKNIVLAAREIGDIGIVRLSPHFYNTRDQVITAVTEIKNYLHTYEQ